MNPAEQKIRDCANIVIGYGMAQTPDQFGNQPLREVGEQILAALGRVVLVMPEEAMPAPVRLQATDRISARRFPVAVEDALTDALAELEEGPASGDRRIELCATIRRNLFPS